MIFPINTPIEVESSIIRLFTVYMLTMDARKILLCILAICLYLKVGHSFLHARDIIDNYDFIKDDVIVKFRKSRIIPFEKYYSGGHTNASERVFILKSHRLYHGQTCNTSCHGEPWLH